MLAFCLINVDGIYVDIAQEMKRILLITSHFPYEGGEQFLETEIQFWGAARNVDLTVMPFSANGRVRRYPENITLTDSLAQAYTPPRRLGYILRALVHPRFWCEVLALATTRNLSIRKVGRACLTLSTILLVVAAIKRNASAATPFDLVYAYWHGAAAYAGAIAKSKRFVRHVVARAHRGDLYEHATPLRYQPFKRQFRAELDITFAISSDGRRCLIEHYGVPPEKVRISRLGVAIGPRRTQASGVNQLAIVSISSCVPNKRIDVLIRGLRCFAKANPDITVKWSHIGGGALSDQLQLLADRELNGLGNVSFCFLGVLPNKQVIDYLATSAIDAIVNVSASEGIPVSIMEAMALGIPAVAPRVGGIPELVTPEFGYLLPQNPDEMDIEKGLAWATKEAKHSRLRETIATTISSDYSAATNYPSFIDTLLSTVQ